MMWLQLAHSSCMKISNKRYLDYHIRLEHYLPTKAGCSSVLWCVYSLSLDINHMIASTYICHLGDNCIQNFHLGRYIFGYTVGNLVLRRRASGDVKRDFRTYIRRYTSPNENFEYGYPHSNALLLFPLKLERWKLHKAARHLTIRDVIYDVKQFPTVYRRIYCRKFWRYPIRRRVTKSSALEFAFNVIPHMVNTTLYHLFNFC